MSEITDGMLDRYADYVKECMESGCTRHKAKELAKGKFPWISEITESGQAGRVGQAYARRGVPGRDNRVAMPKIGASDLTRWLFANWCQERKDVKVGDVYEFCPQFWLDVYEVITGIRYKVTASFTNEFMPSQASDSKLWAEGWEFEPVKGNGAKKSSFRIVKVPAPPEVETKGPVQPPDPDKVFTRAEAEKLAAYAASKALEDFMRNLQMANGRLPI